MKFLILIPVAILTACLVGGVIASGGKQTQNPSQSTAIAPAPVLAKVGEVVSDGDRAVKVLSVGSMTSLSSGNPFIESPVAKGVFVVLVVEATNTGKETGDLTFSSFELTDTQGRTYKSSDSSTVLVVAKQFAGGQQSDDIPPGLTNRFPLVFDVTPDTSGLILNWKGHKIDLQAPNQASEPQAPSSPQVVSPPASNLRPTIKATPADSARNEQQRPTSVVVDGVKVEIPDKPGFNAYVYDPPSNCRASASKNARVVAVFEKGFINIELSSSIDGWYRETYKSCYIYKSQFKLIPAERLPQE